MSTPEHRRNSRRALFQQEPELYDRARPGYPAELFTELAQLAGIGEGSRVLELGAGTGHATEALLDLGAEVTAVELGQPMIEVARKRVAGASRRAHFVTGSFEEWELPELPFQAVAAFSAWHWLDPEIRTTKAAAALAPGGSLITVATRHVAGGSDGFFAEVGACYERWQSSAPKAMRLASSREVPIQSDEVELSAEFEPPELRRYEWERSYSTSAYLELLRTYSDHLALAPDRLEGLLGCVRALIDQRYGGQIIKRHVNELRIARKAI